MLATCISWLLRFHLFKHSYNWSRLGWQTPPVGIPLPNHGQHHFLTMKTSLVFEDPFSNSLITRQVRQCFIGYPNTSNFAKNTLLCIIFSTLFSVLRYPDETLSLTLMFDILHKTMLSSAKLSLLFLRVSGYEGTVCSFSMSLIPCDTLEKKIHLKKMHPPLLKII